MLGGKYPMRECNEYVARVAECEQRSKTARNEGETLEVRTFPATPRAACAGAQFVA
jgi:hypothetical protein